MINIHMLWQSVKGFWWIKMLSCLLKRAFDQWNLNHRLLRYMTLLSSIKVYNFYSVLPFVDSTAFSRQLQQQRQHSRPALVGLWSLHSQEVLSTSAWTLLYMCGSGEICPPWQTPFGWNGKDTARSLKPWVATWMNGKDMEVGQQGKTLGKFWEDRRGLTSSVETRCSGQRSSDHLQCNVCPFVKEARGKERPWQCRTWRKGAPWGLEETSHVPLLPFWCVRRGGDRRSLYCYQKMSREKNDNLWWIFHLFKVIKDRLHMWERAFVSLLS